MSISIDGKEMDSLHFVGVLGIGMSAIAQYLAADCTVSGSDRSLGENQEDEEMLKNAGISLFAQDGSGIGENTDALVVSTAIENDNPDIKKANGFGIPVLHRSEVLSAIVKKCRTVSVSGTSGKSSVSAMIFHILDYAGKNVSFIGGANLHSLRQKGLLGNAYRSENLNEREILVIEADESDGTVVRYFPEISVFLNVSRDHKEIEEVRDLLKTASAQSKLTVFNKDDENFAGFSGKTFGFSRTADYFPERYSCAENSCAFTVGDACAVVNFSGKHTVVNALAAIAACVELGMDLQTAAAALAAYTGIARRFDKYEAARGILVIDDYAHNPEKIAAAVSAAKMRKTPLSLVFQPHGFGPLRFMYDDLKETFLSVINEGDKLYLLPTFYAGGTADKSVDSDKLAADLGDTEKFVFVESRQNLSEILKRTLSAGDTVLVCGARDNSLSAFAKNLAEFL